MLKEISLEKYQEAANKLVIELGYTSTPAPVNTQVSHRCFVYENLAGKIRACVVLYLKAAKYQEEEASFFGNFICVEDKTVFGEVFAGLEKIANEGGAKHLIGPINGSTWNNYRWALENSFQAFPGDVDNPVFYPVYLQKEGYKIISHYQTSCDDRLIYNEEKTRQKEAYLVNSGISFRTLDDRKLQEELKRIHRLSNEAFANNFLFAPIGEKEFLSKYKAWLKLIPKEMILLAEDKKGDLAGFLFAYPDIRRKGKKGAVIKTLARRAEDKYRGLGAVLSKKLYDYLKEEKYDYALHALMQVDNYSVKTSAVFSGREVRSYGLFGKVLNG